MFLYWTLPSFRHRTHLHTSKGHVTWIIKKVNSILTHCGVAYESARSLARDHVIIVWLLCPRPAWPACTEFNIMHTPYLLPSHVLTNNCEESDSNHLIHTCSAKFLTTWWPDDFVTSRGLNEMHRWNTSVFSRWKNVSFF